MAGISTSRAPTETRRRASRLRARRSRRPNPRGCANLGHARRGSARKNAHVADTRMRGHAPLRRPRPRPEPPARGFRGAASAPGATPPDFGQGCSLRAWHTQRPRTSAGSAARRLSVPTGRRLVPPDPYASFTTFESTRQGFVMPHSPTIRLLLKTNGNFSGSAGGGR